MSAISLKAARVILLTAAAYFLICGVSAIFFPISWLMIAELPLRVSNELALTFSVIGSLMTALGIGAIIAAKAPKSSSSLIATLTLANICDFLGTLRAVLIGTLAPIPGTFFLIVAFIWSYLLILTYKSSKAT